MFFETPNPFLGTNRRRPPEVVNFFARTGSTEPLRQLFAVSHGFADQSAFTRHSRKAMGQTSGQFRVSRTRAPNTLKKSLTDSTPDACCLFQIALYSPEKFR